MSHIWPIITGPRDSTYSHPNNRTQSTEVEIKVCMYLAKAGPRQGQTEQLSKSRKKFLATTNKPLFTSLYARSFQLIISGCWQSHSLIHSRTQHSYIFIHSCIRPLLDIFSRATEYFRFGSS